MRLGSVEIDLAVSTTSAGYRLDVRDAGTTFLIHDGGQRIEAHPDPRVSPRLEEILLGPVLALALAMRGVWLVHAGCVERRGAATLFLGESGAGKSTIAASMGRRIADDLVALGLDPAGRPVVRPGYPQLKLGAGEQHVPGGTESLPVESFWEIIPERAASGRLVAKPLSRRNATAALLRHAIAARLFDRGLLRNQLAFAATCARQLPAGRLHYPHHPDSLPTLRRWFADGERLESTASLIAEAQRKKFLKATLVTPSSLKVVPEPTRSDS